ncbi:MAG: threonine--tRNA ligase [Candidatus Yanofskybacteria bacterium RIFCSPHIGHO2_01_FULL_41_21]|uniref:Threonine--tRNA ligase n=1 Tax=Candidatus Yanofskybacteria bacterium RIFCSPHIGHO2_01_FULL_41_21 TaxID=1802660 RepID=A0A1F8ECQ1_9BACT|nr:MAG: threonine--tRNA ligase [Candidatus Yanofskybacteria bacterium RIFCSPHIGHO2_01_FULL_41_21]
MESSLEHLRHSLAHLLGAAVLDLYPGSKLAIGPAIDDGFYYDIDIPEKVSDADLPKIEDKMREILKTWEIFEHFEITPEEAKIIFKDNPYKIELIEELEKINQPISIYYSGPKKNIPTKKDLLETVNCKLETGFIDLCRGGHVEKIKDIEPKTFKLSRLAGAYWRGDEKNPQLTRIYGYAFETKDELQKHITMLEEAKKRDHRKIGKELKLFTFSDFVGPGLPLWLPNGTVIVEELEKLAKQTELEAGYLRVRTPHIAKEIMYKTSGHLPYYADSMFPPMVMKDEDGKEETYYLKAMNCPHHHQIFASEPRSYRDLPLRLAEYGTQYRYEKSGELFGLMRVRMLSMNDAHIYCTPEQFASEFHAVNDMYLKYFEIFGFKKYVMRFSTHDPEKLGKKYLDNAELWKKTEDMVRTVLIDSKIPFQEVKDEAAFYGPKIDVQIWSSIGREFSIATNQVDFGVPERFGLTYTDTDGTDKTPIVIHRAPLGTHERFIGFLIEHYAGAFPLWLSPVQVAVITISENQQAWAEAVVHKLKHAGIRAELHNQNETLGKKIRNAEMQKIPYLFVVGDKEVETQSVAVRKRSQGDVGTMRIDTVVAQLKEEIELKK